MIEAVESINLREEMPNLILATSYELTVLVQEQLYAGKLANDAPIAPSYADNHYAKKKSIMNAAPGFGTPDIFYTGQLYKAMGISVDGDEYQVASTVDYAEKLEIEYGPELFQISDKNADIYANGVLFEAIKTYITGKTGLLFE